MADSVKTFLHDLVRVSLRVSGPLSWGLVSFASVTVGLPLGSTLLPTSSRVDEKI